MLVGVSSHKINEKMPPDRDSLQLLKVFLQWCATLVEYQALVLLKYIKNTNKVIMPLHDYEDQLPGLCS